MPRLWPLLQTWTLAAEVLPENALDRVAFGLRSTGFDGGWHSRNA